MSATAVLKESEASGIEVSLNCDKLAIKCATKPSADLLARLQKHKAGIVALLKQEAVPESGEVEVEERKAMAADSVPEPYLDAWARLQCQRPIAVLVEDWRQAILDGGLFLDQWGKLAVEFGWTANDLFGVPRTDGTGLLWVLKSRKVRSLGPEHAALRDGAQVFDRSIRRECCNPFAPGFRQ